MYNIFSGLLGSLYVSGKTIKTNMVESSKPVVEITYPPKYLLCSEYCNKFPYYGSPPLNIQATIIESTNKMTKTATDNSSNYKINKIVKEFLRIPPTEFPRSPSSFATLKTSERSNSYIFTKKCIVLGSMTCSLSFYLFYLYKKRK